MQCQTEGCYENAKYGVQLMNARGYRVGMCEECSRGELAEIGEDFDQLKKEIDAGNVTSCSPIKLAEWWSPVFASN